MRVWLLCVVFATLCCFTSRVQASDALQPQQFGGFVEDPLQTNFPMFDMQQQQHFLQHAIRQSQETMPSPRSDTSCVIRAMDAIYVFGGMGQQRQALGDFWKFSTNTNSWSIVHAVNNTQPPVRLWHAAAIRPDWARMFVFGGFNMKDSLNDLWRYSFAENEWKEIKPNTVKPQPRDRHSMVFFQKSLIVFGGFVGAPTNEMWRYSTEDNLWTLMETSAPSSGGPHKRRSHGACIHKEKMFIFGGNNAEKQFGDLWAFDFESSSWSELSTTNSPSKRSRVGLVADNIGHLFLFGGFDGANYKFDLWKYTLDEGWELLDPNFDRPVERADFAVGFQKSVNPLDLGRVFVFGGFDGQSRLNDLFKYEVASNEWQEYVLQ